MRITIPHTTLGIHLLTLQLSDFLTDLHHGVKNACSKQTIPYIPTHPLHYSAFNKD